MVKVKKKGYVAERKIRKIFEDEGWKVIRAGASFGEADLVCIKKGKCILLQVKSCSDKKFYYYGYMKEKLEGIPFYVVVDFGYGKIRISKPKKVISLEDEPLENFLKENK